MFLRSAALGGSVRLPLWSTLWRWFRRGQHEELFADRQGVVIVATANDPAESPFLTTGLMPCGAPSDRSVDDDYLGLSAYDSVNRTGVVGGSNS